MSQINNNLPSLINLNALNRNNNSLNTTLRQLSTGLQINRGADNPAGLIAAENLGAELKAIEAAISNNDRANNVIATAEGALSEISGLLSETQGLAVAAANSFMSDAERDAIQFQIDSNLSAIDRISNTASFNGNTLFNGSNAINTSNQDTTNVSNADVIALQNLPEGGQDLEVEVTQTAQQASLFLELGDTELDLESNDSSFTIEIEGAEGAREFNFSDGTTLDDIAQTINDASDETGVSATVDGTSIQLSSDDYGSEESVSVEIIDDGGQSGSVQQSEAEDPSSADASTAQDFSDLEGANAVSDEGRDVGGTINGQVASGDGLELTVSNPTLEASLTLTESAATTQGSFTGVTVDGGGATFALSSDISSVNNLTISLPNLDTNNLGRATVDGETFTLGDIRRGGSASVGSGNTEALSSVLSSAISEVATLRGRLGSIQRNTIQPSINSLNTAFENTVASRSQIADTDFALATANLARDQILLQSSLLNQGLANSQANNVLSLLG